MPPNSKTLGSNKPPAVARTVYSLTTASGNQIVFSNGATATVTY